MTETSYDVHIWQVKARKNAKGKITSYRLRWLVGHKEHHAPFKTRAHADSFRADLVAAARKGEAFLVESGLPVSMARTQNEMGWLAFAKEYTEMKWPTASASHRRGIVQSLTAVTVALIPKTGRPEQPLVHKALAKELNPNRSQDLPEELLPAWKWLSKNDLSVAALAKPDVIRRVLNGIAIKLDGQRTAPDTFRLRRVILDNLLDYAVEKKLLDKTRLTRSRSTYRNARRRWISVPW